MELGSVHEVPNPRVTQYVLPSVYPIHDHHTHDPTRSQKDVQKSCRVRVYIHIHHANRDDVHPKGSSHDDDCRKEGCASHDRSDDVQGNAILCRSE